MKNDKEIDYIARHYREDRFNINRALQQTGLKRRRLWTPAKIAAAAAAFVIISATAAVIIHQSYLPDTAVSETPVIQKSVVNTEKKAVDFENSALPVVVAEIEDVYGVEVENMPDNAHDYILSLHYEGTAVDLINTINEILGTEMKIKE